MSTIGHSPLGNFEERLLLQLKAEVAGRPAPLDVARKPRRAGHLRAANLPSRIAMGLGGAVAAVVVAALSTLPAAQPALARAFPILTHQTVSLPDRYRRALQAQHRATPIVRIAHDRAYSFQTPSGTGYVVVDPRDRWLCILIPKIGSNSSGIRCETAHQLLQTRVGGIRVVTKHGNRHEIVELVRQDATATVTADGTRSTVDRNGILTITTNSSATITTTIAGKRSTTTYHP